MCPFEDKQKKLLPILVSIDNLGFKSLETTLPSILVSFYSDIEYRTNFVISYEDKKVSRAKLLYYLLVSIERKHLHGKA